jgi:hypothetical protein
MGAATMSVGMAAFFVLRSNLYSLSTRDVIWTVTAFVVGPIAGACGAKLAVRDREPIWAVAFPSALLISEAAWFVLERHPWRNVTAEHYRLIDLAIVAALFLAGLLLPLFFERDKAKLPLIYAVVLGASIAGTALLASFKWVLLHL